MGVNTVSSGDNGGGRDTLGGRGGGKSMVAFHFLETKSKSKVTPINQVCDCNKSD